MVFREGRMEAHAKTEVGPDQDNEANLVNFKSDSYGNTQYPNEANPKLW